jgi:hypothetical protein
MQWHLADGVEGVISVRQLECCTVASHHRLGLHVKVAQHFIEAPTSNEADNVCAGVSTLEGGLVSCG